MVITKLDDKLIQGGEILVKQLDDAEIVVDAAFWFFFSDVQAWKLMISLPGLINQGPKAAYQAVQQALLKANGKLQISLDDIAVTQPDASLLKLLRIAINTGKGISGIRFSNNVINGQLVEDAYIYRLLPIKTKVG